MSPALLDEPPTRGTPAPPLARARSGFVDGSCAALREVARVLRPGGLFVHETPVAQHLAHPVRSFGRTLPWASVPALARDRVAVLWGARRKT